MRVVSLNQYPSMEDALKVIDDLRRDVAAGKVTAFVVSAINDGDETIAYASSIKHVTRLRVQGAMAQVLHNWMAGEI